MVGVSVISGSVGGVVSSPPAGASVAVGSALSVAADPEADSLGDADGSPDSLGVGDVDEEADAVGAVVPAGPDPGCALVVARARSARSAAVPGVNGAP